MYSTIRAVVDLLSVFFVEEKVVEKPKSPPKTPEKSAPTPDAPPPISKYSFVCYLCSAETKFSMEPVTKKTLYTVDCIRCGYENRVVVKPKVT